MSEELVENERDKILDSSNGETKKKRDREVGDFDGWKIHLFEKSRELIESHSYFRGREKTKEFQRGSESLYEDTPEFVKFNAKDFSNDNETKALKIVDQVRLVYLPDWGRDMDQDFEKGGGPLSPIEFSFELSKIQKQLGKPGGRNAVMVNAVSNFPYLSADYEIMYSTKLGIVDPQCMKVCNTSYPLRWLPELGYKPPSSHGRGSDESLEYGNVGILDPMTDTSDSSVVHVHVPHEDWYRTYQRTEVKHKPNGISILIHVSDPMYVIVQCYLDHVYRACSWGIGLLEYLDTTLSSYSDLYLRIQASKEMKKRGTSSMSKDALLVMTSARKQQNKSDEWGRHRLRSVERSIVTLWEMGFSKEFSSDLLPYAQYVFLSQQMTDIYTMSMTHVRRYLMNSCDEGESSNGTGRNDWIGKNIRKGCNFATKVLGVEDECHRIIHIYRNVDGVYDISLSVVCFDVQKHFNRVMMQRRLGKTNTPWARKTNRNLHAGDFVKLRRENADLFYVVNDDWFKKVVMREKRTKEEETDNAKEIAWAKLGMWQVSHPSFDRKVVYAIRVVTKQYDYFLWKGEKEKKRKVLVDEGVEGWNKETLMKVNDMCRSIVKNGGKDWERPKWTARELNMWKRVEHCRPFTYKIAENEIQFDQSYLPGVIEVTSMNVEVTSSREEKMKDRFHRLDRINGTVDCVKGVPCVYDATGTGMLFSKAPVFKSNYVFGGTKKIACCDPFLEVRNGFGDIALVSSSDVKRMATMERYLNDTYQNYKKVLSVMHGIDNCETNDPSYLRDATGVLNMIWALSTYDTIPGKID